MDPYELELWGHGDPQQGFETLSSLITDAIKHAVGDSRYPYWLCMDGKIMRVEDMTESHLTNALAMVRRRKTTKTRARIIRNFEAEQVRRAMSCSYSASMV